MNRTRNANSLIVLDSVKTFWKSMNIAPTQIFLYPKPVSILVIAKSMDSVDKAFQLNN